MRSTPKRVAWLCRRPRSSEVVSTATSPPTAASTNRSRKWRTRPFTNSAMSIPASAIRPTNLKAPATSRSSTSEAASNSMSASTSPSSPSTSSSLIVPPPNETSCSSVVMASRIPPSACLAISVRAPSGTSTFSASLIVRSLPTMSSTESRRKSNLWQREWIVSGTLWGCVVHRMNTVRSGGSSSDLSRALNAEVDSMCTSSMM